MAPVTSKPSVAPAPAAPGSDGWATGPASSLPPPASPARAATAPGTVDQLLTAATADKQITKAEWDQIRTVADAGHHVASADAREVLTAWANDSFKVEDSARSGMRDYLVSCGYDVPTSRPASVPQDRLVDGILGTNVGEEDTDYSQVAALAGRASQETTIAVLDGGIDLANEEFAGKEWVNTKEIAGNGIDDDGNGKADDVHGWDFADNDANVKDIDHGSHVTGIATRGTSNVNSISCRVFGSDLDGKEVAAAIDYAAANGARVMNMSFKVMTAEEVKVISAAMARHPDVLFVKSAGNDGNKIDGGSYKPESYLPFNQIPNMAVVAAADADGTRASYSNYGAPYATLGARGSEVLSTVNDGRYQSMSGTSMASPNVTAVAAKCLNLDPKLDPVALQGILADTSVPSAAWKGVTKSGGLVSEHDAIRVAALTGLARGGKTLEAAADQLKITGPERKALIAIAAKYAPVATV